MNQSNAFFSILGLAVVFACACGAGQVEPEAQPATTPAPTGANDPPAAEAAATQPAQPAAPADAPLEIHARGEVGEGGDVALVVEVRDGTARLAKSIGVEREVNGHFEQVTGIAGLELRADCQTAAPDCVEAVAGAELRPPPWLGTIGDAQCVCTRCAPAPAGSYRFVLRSCDGSQRVESESFALPAR